jgi:hypothetical protein
VGPGHLVLAWVCGCDGEDYSNDWRAFGKGVTVAAEGKCRYYNKSCAELDAMYKKLLEDARACGSDADCSFTTPATLTCDCRLTRVNGRKVDMIEHNILTGLGVKQSCQARGCPCRTPTGATCQSGTCTDQF